MRTDSIASIYIKRETETDRQTDRQTDRLTLYNRDELYIVYYRKYLIFDISKTTRFMFFRAETLPEESPQETTDEPICRNIRECDTIFILQSWELNTLRITE